MWACMYIHLYETLSHLYSPVHQLKRESQICSKKTLFTLQHSLHNTTLSFITTERMHLHQNILFHIRFTLWHSLHVATLSSRYTTFVTHTHTHSLSLSLSYTHQLTRENNYVETHYYTWWHNETLLHITCAFSPGVEVWVLGSYSHPNACMLAISTGSPMTCSPT